MINSGEKAQSVTKFAISCCLPKRKWPRFRRSQDHGTSDTLVKPAVGQRRRMRARVRCLNPAPGSGRPDACREVLSGLPRGGPQSPCSSRSQEVCSSASRIRSQFLARRRSTSLRETSPASMRASTHACGNARPFSAHAVTQSVTL